MNVGQKRLPPTSLAKFGFLGALGGTGLGAAAGVIDQTTNPHADFNTVQNHAIQGGLLGLAGGVGIGGIYKAFDGLADTSLKQSFFTNSSVSGFSFNPTNKAQQLVQGF